MLAATAPIPNELVTEFVLLLKTFEILLFPHLHYHSETNVFSI
jgi:hypothetical protein